MVAYDGDGMAGAARGNAQHGTVIARAIRERKDAGCGCTATETPGVPGGPALTLGSLRG